MGKKASVVFSLLLPVRLKKWRIIPLIECMFITGIPYILPAPEWNYHTEKKAVDGYCGRQSSVCLIASEIVLYG